MQLYTQEIIHHFNAKLVQFIPKLVVGGVIFIGFYLLAIVLKVVITRIANRTNSQRQQVILLLAQVAKAIALIVGAITALGSMGVNISALVASLGLSGFALSFALKDMLSNTLAGVMLLVYSPFKVGDEINVLTFAGKVKAINLRYTTLNADAETILIPNSILLTNSIKLSKH